MSQDTGAAGIFVIRAWTDAGSFRARVRLTSDVTNSHEGSAVTDDPAEVLAMVSAWLETFRPAHNNSGRLAREADSSRRKH